MYSIDQIRLANQKAGNLFFSPANMRAFGTRLLSTVHEGPGGVYFVTEEEGVAVHDDTRIYCVRRFDPTTAGVRSAYDEHRGRSTRFETAQQALQVARRLAAEGEPTE